MSAFLRLSRSTDQSLGGLRYLEGVLDAPRRKLRPGRRGAQAASQSAREQAGRLPACPRARPWSARPPARPPDRSAMPSSTHGAAAEGPPRVPSARIDDLMTLVSSELSPVADSGWSRPTR